MKKSGKIAIIAGICVAVILGGSALFVHSKLLEIEKTETGQESAEQIAKEALEVLNGKEPHSEEDEFNSESRESHSEVESKEQHEKELP